MSQLAYRQLPADLGLEPPLSTEGAALPALMRGRVNYRWLAGIVLTGITGAGLMLLSVAGALGPLRNAISEPQISRASRDERVGTGGAAIALRRGEKLIRRANLVASRQDYKTTVQVRQGDAMVTRQASFTRLAAPLALETLGYSESVPAFNVARLVSLASEDRAALEAEGASPTTDTEVGLSIRDISAARDLPHSGIVLKEQDALAQVFDFLSERRRDPGAEAAQSRLAKVMRAPTEGTALLSFSTAGVGDPFSKLVVRMVPQNVTPLPRQDAVLTPLPIEERLVLSRNEAATRQTLKSVGVEPRQADAIVAALTRNRTTNALDGNGVLKLALQPLEAGGPKALMRVELFIDEKLAASAGRRDDGTFVPVEVREIAPKPPADASNTSEDDEEGESNSTRLTIYAAIYETAKRQEIPAHIVEDAIRTVFFDVDLQRRVQPGDSIELLIANGETDQTRPELQLVSLTTGGIKRRYYRFKVPDEDVIDFFDDQGRSVKQFLLRKPIDGGELRSTFGMRRHPILRYYRLHSGVDWAGPVGMPIRAAGNGTVRLAEWDSGYGRRVEIEHNHGYVTTYNHMSAFAPGIKAGSRVRQGQIIGRLGSSGLSTGPHLHYEVMINERFVDPLAIKLPKGRELAGRQLATFKRERDQIETVLKAAPGANALVAQN